MSYKILEIDPYLANYKNDIDLRMDSYKNKRKELLGKSRNIVDFANGYQYFGFHRTKEGWVYREWAPAAEAMYLTGDFNHWDATACPMTALDNGVFQVKLKGQDALKEGMKVQAVVIYNGEQLRRIPTYATRVVQDPTTYLWCAEIEETMAPFAWTDKEFKPDKTPFIYECHIGMAQDKYDIGTYEEFRVNI